MGSASFLVGLDRADKIASIVGAITGMTGLGLAGWQAVEGRGAGRSSGIGATHDSTETGAENDTSITAGQTRRDTTTQHIEDSLHDLAFSANEIRDIRITASERQPMAVAALAAVAMLLAVAAGASIIAATRSPGSVDQHQGNEPGPGRQSADIRPNSVGPVPKGPVVIIQNMVAIGADSLLEDTTPAYLSTQPAPRCSRNGCMLPNSILTTGTTVVAICNVTGAEIANYNLDSTEVQRNPHRVRSTLWYRLMLSDGRSGYLSEVYVAPATRGGLGLPTCAVGNPVASA